MKTKNPSAPKSLVHLTLNSGHRNDSPRSEVTRETLERLAFLVSPRTAPPLRLPWDISIKVEAERGFGTFQLTKEGHRIASCVVAFGSDDAFAWHLALEAFKFDKTAPRPRGDSLPLKPASIPWLSVHLHAGALLRPMSEIGMLGDFERCVAWAIIEQYRHVAAAF